MVIDVVTWFAEEDMFRLRMRMLGNLVDLFVVVEADVTHQGGEKPWAFPTDLLGHPKVCWVQVSLTSTTAWGRENEQRRAMREAVAQFASDDDVVIFSDCDEIWGANFLDDLTSTRAALMDFRLFSIFWRYSTDWPGSIGGRWGDLRHLDWQGLRDRRYQLPSTKSGWHFSWMGDDETLLTKRQSFAHTEFAGSDVVGAAGAGRWLNGRQMSETDDGLPEGLVRSVPSSWKNKR